jgi:hypothetical protein
MDRFEGYIEAGFLLSRSINQAEWALTYQIEDLIAFIVPVADSVRPGRRQL